MEAEESSAFAGQPILVDFLTHKGKIAAYAKQKEPKPTIPQLVDLILRQASLENKDETYQRIMRCHRVDVDNRTFSPNPRNRSTKVMTLKLASAINWNLDLIEKDMSITMQFCLVQDLMNNAFVGTNYCSSISDVVTDQQERLLSSFSSETISGLPDPCIFGLVIYMWWILRAHIQRKIPKKPARGGIVNMGSITDPDVLEGLDQQAQGNSLIWTLFRQISHEKVSQTALDILSSVIQLDRTTIKIPTVDSFVISDRQMKLIDDHDWSIGIDVPFAELRASIYFELAKYWLFEGNFGKVAEYLDELKKLLGTINIDQPTYFTIDKDTLISMFCLAGIFPEKCVDSPKEKLTPSAKQRNIELLLEDLPGTLYNADDRFNLEQEIKLNEDLTARAFYVKVRLCSFFTELIAGKATFSATILQCILSDGTASDADWLRNLLNKDVIPQAIRKEVIDGLRSLVAADKVPGSMKQKLTDLPSLDKRSEAEISPEDVEMSENISPTPSAVPDPLSAFSYATIKRELLEYVRSNPGKTAKDINASWASKVPPTLRSTCSGASWTPELTELVFAVFARAAELTEQGCFHVARKLLKDLREDLPSVPAKLEKNFKWQLTYVDLMGWLEEIPSPLFPEEESTDAIRRAKSCITSTFMKLPDDEPVPIYVQNVALMVLFNLEVWDYIEEIASTQDVKKKSTGSAPSLSSIFPFLKLLIAVCNEFTPQREDLLAQSRGIQTKQATVNRQQCMKLWNTLSAILGKPTSQDPKKPTTTTPSAAVPVDIFWFFAKMIRHKTALYILTSCLFRMWSVICRETNNMPLVTEILWPSSIPLSTPVVEKDAASALETFVDIMEKARFIDWEMWRAEGNYYLCKNEHPKALRMFLLSGVQESSVGYLHPASSPVFDTVIIKKMIQCFEAMKCYTCVAVLCQLLAPVDFDTANRVLSEKVSYDAGDGLYKYIWEPNILENLAFILQKSGYLEKRQLAIDALQDPLLNAANPAAVLERTRMERTAEFFEVMFDQYVLR